MNLKKLLGRLRRDTSIDQLAQDVAERCRHDVWDRVWRRATVMESSEARGYIRARAALVVSREVDWVTQQSTSRSATRRNRLFDLSLANVTQMILLEARAVRMAPARRAA